MKWVPLTSARASFGGELDRLQSARAQSVRGRAARSVGPVEPRPRRSTERKACADGARSPLAPSEPVRGTTGTMPALRSGATRSTTSGRTPEWPRSRPLSRMASAARTTSARERLSDAGRMAAEHVTLHRRGLLERDALAHERSEARRHAVDRVAALDRLLERRAVRAERRRALRAIDDHRRPRRAMLPRRPSASRVTP